MKALLFAAAFAALSSTVFAGAAREAYPKADTTTVAVIADAGRLSSTGLTPLNDGSPWADNPRTVSTDGGFDAYTSDVDIGTLIIGLGVVAFLLFRPLARALRRQERQRRAAALASTLGNIQHR